MFAGQGVLCRSWHRACVNVVSLSFRSCIQLAPSRCCARQYFGYCLPSLLISDMSRLTGLLFLQCNRRAMPAPCDTLFSSSASVPSVRTGCSPSRASCASFGCTAPFLSEADPGPGVAGCRSWSHRRPLSVSHAVWSVPARL